jgi:hypothetical protein
VVFITVFQTKTDNAKMTGTRGCKEAKYNEIDFLILDIFGMDSASVDGLDGDD